MVYKLFKVSLLVWTGLDLSNAVAVHHGCFFGLEQRVVGAAGIRNAWADRSSPVPTCKILYINQRGF